LDYLTQKSYFQLKQKWHKYLFAAKSGTSFIVPIISIWAKVVSGSISVRGSSLNKMPLLKNGWLTGVFLKR
jgi:hypothetical protein